MTGRKQKEKIMFRYSMGLLVALFVTVSMVSVSTPARAQTSCMHCNFAHGKCNMFKPGKEAVCAKEREDCIRKCKAKAAGKPATQNKASAKKDKK
jgi:hypothetical protein